MVLVYLVLGRVCAGGHLGSHSVAQVTAGAAGERRALQVPAVRPASKKNRSPEGPARRACLPRGKRQCDVCSARTRQLGNTRLCLLFP